MLHSVQDDTGAVVAGALRRSSSDVNQYYVYILKCSDGSFYVGVTNDIERRVGEHQSGWNPKCYTHERRPVRLVYSERFANVEEAIAWEKRVKGWSRKKKIALVMGDFEKIHEIDKQQHRHLLSS